MKIIIKFNFLILIILFATTGYSQEKTDKSNRIDSLLKKEYQDKNFNGNVLVVQKNKTLYENSFGYADPSQKVKLNKNFKFQIGSIYKEFPGVAIMQLNERGLISLEDNIHKYIPELPLWSKDISIKNLLQYSSGLPKIQYQKYPPEKIVTYKEIYSDIIDVKQLEFKPGTSYLYTNYSPLLLMKIVENVTHQTFTDYAKEHLFDSNEFDIREEYPYKDINLMAISFDKNRVADPFQFSEFTTVPFLTASDTWGLYEWFKKIHENKLISQESKVFLAKTANIFRDDHMESALGTVKECQEPLSDSTNIIEHTHDGTLGNFRTIVRRFNAIDLTIIILTNQDNNNIYTQSREIYKIVTN